MVRRGRVPWRFLLIALAISVAMVAWYVLTVDAIREDTGSVVLRDGQGVTLAGVDPRERIGFSAYVLKDVSLLPVTILGIEPVPTVSDWRLREMRLGILTAGSSGNSLEQTRPFTPQHLAPGEVAHVVVVWEALPCDSPRLADGVVSGPVEFRIQYAILGVHRTLTFHQGGGGFAPVSVFGCPS